MRRSLRYSELSSIRSARFAHYALGLLLLAACGEQRPSATPTPSVSPPGARPPEYPSDDASWGKFHSKRFQLTVPLPDGKGWKIDDHRAPELVATHPPTDSRLTLAIIPEENLMNRQRCEERARARGWVGEKALETVEDRVQVGPDAYDSRVWVAIDPTDKGAIVGHVFLFGAFLRRCLLVHVTTSVPSRDDEGVLASRLAVASARIAGGITLDAPRTTESATVPRDKPAGSR